MPYKLDIIHEGYSKSVTNGMEANCTCTLIRGNYNMIVDTMTPWDANIILEGLEKFGLQKEDIHYVVSSHGHSDHLGNNHLFLNALHIVGHCISKKNLYFDEPFSTGGSYKIDEELKVVGTPGHTLSDVTVIVRTADGLVAVTGDLFEREEDLENEYLWLGAGSEAPALQRYNRARILAAVDYIVPGHGGIFKVPQQLKQSLTHFSI